MGRVISIVFITIHTWLVLFILEVLFLSRLLSSLFFYFSSFLVVIVRGNWNKVRAKSTNDLKKKLKRY